MLRATAPCRAAAGSSITAAAGRRPLVNRLQCRRRSSRVAASSAPAAAAIDPSALKEALHAAKRDLAELIQSTRCNPILLRIAFHDACTYDRRAKTGGAVGATHFQAVRDHPANAGLPVAVSLLEPIKAKHQLVSWADLFQLSSAVAVELAGGPQLPLRYGRVDAPAPDPDAPGNLPEAAPPAGHSKFGDGSKTAAEHLRNVFAERAGLSDVDIVALSGAHTLGRAKPSRSGFGKEQTSYTKDGPGTPGGSSWTPDWLQFNNDYYVQIFAAKEGKGDAELLVLPTDAAVFDDPAFAVHGKRFAEDQRAFFDAYVEAHVKMSELGVTWAPGTPVTL